MSKPEPAALRAVAALVIRRGLDGRTFPLAVERTQAAGTPPTPRTR